MGIGYHGLQFLCFAAKQAQFGRVATIGRQELFLQKEEVGSMMGLGAEYKHEKYCEDLLSQHFGAESVDSWDYSDYQGARHVADMNVPFEDLPPTYDTVINAGSLEHIFNAPQALLNVTELCREGGQILHILPANNFCGHGFWQFWPELSFSLYSEVNGYSSKRIFLASEYRTDVWHEVLKPDNGPRVNIISFTPVFILCRSVKTGWCGDYDQGAFAEIAVLKRHKLRPGAKAFNLGANQCIQAMMMAKELGPEGVVWAVEPNPWNVRAGLKNCEFNGVDNVRLIEAAASSKLGQIRFNSAMNGHVAVSEHEAGTHLVEFYSDGNDGIFRQIEKGTVLPAKRFYLVALSRPKKRDLTATQTTMNQ